LHYRIHEGDTMFKIGDFSRLSQVSVKTLHHYDAIGLFQPIHVDEWTGYRYYSFEQLPRLNRILALKDLGFSLEQIRRALDETINAEEIAGMLRLRQAELQQQMEESRERLKLVEMRLSIIQKEGKMPTNEILLKSVAPVWVISAREIVPSPEQMRERCIALMNTLDEAVKSRKLPSTGTSLAIYHSNSEAGIDVEMAYFLEGENPPQGEGVHQLPALEMASAVYRGSYDDFAAVGALHMALGQWIEDNGYTVAGANREIYLQPPSNLGNGLVGVMELQYPVAKA
jgi:DNA-binding transcriptional MerR regulator